MKKNIFLWTLYDFANSIIMIAFLFYFSQWLTVDSAKPDWWFNVTLIVSSALYLVTAPFLAHRLDINHKKLFGLRIMSLILVIFYVLTALVMLLAPTHALLATVFFTLSMYTYLLSFIYYTPMLNDLTNDTNRGWVSGLGQAMNYFGQVFGLIVSLPFASGAIYLFGSHGRPQTLLPAIILFIICALPLLIWYKEPIREKKNYGKSFSEIFVILKKVVSIRNLTLVFIAYFLFSDALLTFSNNFPIFLEKVFGVSDAVKSYLAGGILTFSVIGSIIFGKISDKWGTRKTLLLLLICWVILFPLLAFTTSFTIATIICVFAGLFFGPVWAVSRAMVAENTPRDIEASSFGLYILAERFATFIGPIIWSIVLATTASQGATSYSYAIVSMGILVLISVFVIRKIKPDNV